MSGKIWSCWIFLVGLSWIGVVQGNRCIISSLDVQLTGHLLNDHWFKIKHFQPPGETVEARYTSLSIINMFCSSWKDNNNYSKTCVPENDSNDVRYCVFQTYRLVLRKYIEDDKANDNRILSFCEQNNCSFSYSESFINSDQLKQLYYNSCMSLGQNEPLPACPSAQSTSPSPSPTTSTTTTTLPTTTTSTLASTSSSASTSTQQSISTSSSSSSSSSHSTSFTSLHVSNGTSSTQSSYTASPVANDVSRVGCLKNAAQSKSQNVMLTILLIVSVLGNVVLLMIVWRQHQRNNHRDPQDVSTVIELQEITELTGLQCQNGPCGAQNLDCANGNHRVLHT